MEAFDEQGKHRRHLEKTVIEAKTKAMTMGQWMAFGLSVFVIGLGVYLIMNDKQTGGFVAILSALGTLLGVFVVGRGAEYLERRDNRRKLSARRR